MVKDHLETMQFNFFNQHVNCNCKYFVNSLATSFQGCWSWIRSNVASEMTGSPGLVPELDHPYQGCSYLSCVIEHQTWEETTLGIFILQVLEIFFMVSLKAKQLSCSSKKHPFNLRISPPNHEEASRKKILKAVW